VKVPPATCLMVCARSGTKSGSHVFAFRQPIPHHLCHYPCTIRGVWSKLAIFSTCRHLPQASSAHSDRLIPYPVSPLGFSSSLSPCLKGDRWDLEWKHRRCKDSLRLRTFNSPLFIRTPFVRKVLRAAGAPAANGHLHNACRQP
jgi:hypothetical protein